MIIERQRRVLVFFGDALNCDGPILKALSHFFDGRSICAQIEDETTIIFRELGFKKSDLRKTSDPDWTKGSENDYWCIYYQHRLQELYISYKNIDDNEMRIASSWRIAGERKAYDPEELYQSTRFRIRDVVEGGAITFGLDLSKNAFDEWIDRLKRAIVWTITKRKSMSQ